MSIVVDRRSFYTSMVSVVYVMVLQGIISPHVSIAVLEEIGLFWVSLLTLGFMIARSTAAFIHAPLYQRYSARIVGLLGLALLITSYYLYSVTPPITYPLIQLMTGFASGLFWPLMQSLLANGLNPSWRSRGFSIYFILGAVSGYVGYQLGSLIYVLLGPQHLYIIGYTAGLFYLIIYYLMSPTTRTTMERKGRDHMWSQITKGVHEVKPLLPLIILVGGVNGLLKDYLLAYTKQVTGYDEPTIRNIWSIAGYMGLLLGYIGSYLQEKHKLEKQVLAISTGMLLTLAILPFTHQPLIVFTIISLVIAGSRILRPVIRGLASNMTSRPEVGIAVVNGVSNISAALTPLAIAALTTIPV